MQNISTGTVSARNPFKRAELDERATALEDQGAKATAFDVDLGVADTAPRLTDNRVKERFRRTECRRAVGRTVRGRPHKVINLRAFVTQGRGVVLNVASIERYRNAARR